MNIKHKEARKILLKYLSHLAKEKDISILEISKKTGLNEITIIRLFEGKFNPSLEQFISIADAINCYFFVIDKDADDELVKTMKNRYNQNKN